MSVQLTYEAGGLDCITMYAAAKVQIRQHIACECWVSFTSECGVQMDVQLSRQLLEDLQGKSSEILTVKGDQS